MKKYLLIALAMWALGVYSQCPGGQSELEIIIEPDNWPEETSWEVKNDIGQVLASGDSEGDLLCVDTDACLVFTLYDSYGDGIFEPGGYWVYLDGDSVAAGGTNFDYEISHFINCNSASICQDAEEIEPGSYSATETNHWYTFTPDFNAEFNINACGSGCNSAVWVYSSCAEANNDDLNTIAFNSDACENNGSVNVNFFYGMTYYIRIGSPDQSCGPINWSMEQVGPADPCEDEPGLVEALVHIVPDNYPGEISWDIVDGMGNELASGGAEGQSVCVDQDACIIFNIYDSYGDGIFSPGGYWFYYDGELVGTGNNYGYGTYEEIGCPPGTSCNSPEEIGEGDFTTDSGSYWYLFTPDINGSYTLSTCDLNGCDTRIQIYDYCDMSNFDDTQVGANYFNESNDDCGEEAFVVAGLEGGVPYWIRISEVNEDCNGTINWNLNYNGPVEGCTDPSACNFNPLAELSDDSCLYPGDPDCPDGPDLVLNEEYLHSSMYVSSMTVGEGDCYINEGCLNGYGQRELIRFGTRIDNIGNLDFYIGNAASQPQMFTYDNCHNHNHVDGYAEYLLYEMDGTEIPIGFKFGFCVMDLNCSYLGGTAQYGCGDMGISAQCTDVYGAGLSCQWIDVTDVPDGIYTMVVRTNWEFLPDALGNYELDYNNNWAQACIEIDRSSGSLEVELQDECDPLIDCAGDIYGSAQPDCTGECNGTTLRGDLDNNNTQDVVDAHLYVDAILGNDIEATNCNDLNSDGNITVTDPALMALCDIYNVAHEHPDSSGVHTHCNFPSPHLVNPFDTVIFNMTNVNFNENYFDIMVKNPNCKIVGFQVEVSGVDITDVEMLYDSENYPITPEFLYGGQTIIGLSYEDSLISKNLGFTPLCRVYFTNPGLEICLANVVDVVNDDYENTLNFIEKNCVMVTGISQNSNPFNAHISPNPMRDYAILEFFNPRGQEFELDLLDLSGRILRSNDAITTNRFTIQRDGLAPGAYLYRLRSDGTESTGRIIVQ